MLAKSIRAFKERWEMNSSTPSLPLAKWTWAEKVMRKTSPNLFQVPDRRSRTLRNVKLMRGPTGVFVFAI